MSELSHVLTAIEEGDFRAAEELFPLVYDELRRLAVRRMADEAAGNTLQPTALVHEAWLRVVGSREARFANSAHIFAAAAEAMRRILIDRARRKSALRHGGAFLRVELAEGEEPMVADEDQALDVHEALDRLAEHYPVEAEVVKLRYFVGMTNEEAAQALGLSTRTVKYYWTHARAWLYDAINSSGR